MNIVHSLLYIEHRQLYNNYLVYIKLYTICKFTDFPPSPAILSMLAYYACFKL